MYCMGFLAVLLVSVAVIWWSVSSEMKEHRAARAARKTAIEKALSSLPDFKPTLSSLSYGELESGIAIDEERRRVCLFTQKGAVQGHPTFRFRVIKYNEILKSEIVEDGSVLTETSRSSQVAGALIGGLLAGEAGAMIGGLSGTTRQTKAVTGLALRITVNDAADPLHTIQFLIPGVECKAGSPYHKEALGHASIWQGRISVLMHQGKSQGEMENYAGSCEPGDWTLAVRGESDLESKEQSMEDAGSAISPSSSANFPSQENQQTGRRNRSGVWSTRAVLLIVILLVIVLPLWAIAVSQIGSTRISTSGSLPEATPRQPPSPSQDRPETLGRPDDETRIEKEKALLARIASDDVMRAAVAKSTKPEMQLTLEKAFGVYEKSLQANTHGNGLAEDQKQAGIEKEAKQFSNLFSTSIILQGWIVEVYSVDTVHTIGKISGADLSCKVFYGSNCSVACSIIVVGAKNLEVATNLKSGDLIRFGGHTTRVVRPFGKNNLWSRFAFDVAADKIVLIRSYKE
jgi:hypothetical protein